MTTHSCPEALCLASQSPAPVLMFQAAHTWLWSSYLCMWNSKKPKPKEILDHETNLWFGLSSTQSNLSKLVKIQLARIFHSTEATRKYFWLCHVRNYLEMSIYYQREMRDYHKAEPNICRNLGDKNTRRSRNSVCSLLSGALGVRLCLFLSVTGDSAGSVHGKCNALIMNLPFSITPISEGHRGTESQDDSGNTSMSPYYSEKKCLFGCPSLENILPSFHTLTQWLL